MSALVLAVVDEALELPSRQLLLAEPPTEAKMRYEMHRLWVSFLALLTTNSLSEVAAVATQRLRALNRWVASEIASDDERLHTVISVEPATDVPAAQPDAAVYAQVAQRQENLAGANAFNAHVAALEHLLRLWERGQPLPGGWK